MASDSDMEPAANGWVTLLVAVIGGTMAALLIGVALGFNPVGDTIYRLGSWLRDEYEQLELRYPWQ